MKDKIIKKACRLLSKKTIEKIKALLAHPRTIWVCALLCMILSLPSLGVGRVIDDIAHKHMLEADNFISRAPYDLYSFMPDSETFRKDAIDEGILPWFSDPDIHVEFFRPISSLTLYLDHLLWPEITALAHLHSMFWFFLLILIVGLVYRQIHSQLWIAGLATLLFAIDDGHGQPIGWIANRGAVISLVFATLCLLFHIKWRQKDWKPGAILAPLMLLLGLFSAEMALSITAYLFAFALLLDKGSLTHRLLTLLPYAVVSVVWRLIYNGLGYGTRGSGLYFDPLQDPLRYTLAVFERMPVLFLGQFTPLTADVYLFLEPGIQKIILGIGILFIIFVLMVTWKICKKDRVAAFWALSTIISALPACATFALDRMMLAAGIGGMGFVASVIGKSLTDFFDTLPEENLDEPQVRQKLISKLFNFSPFSLQGLAVFWIFCHLILSPVMLPLRTYSSRWLQDSYDSAYRSLDQVDDFKDKTLIIVYGPDYFFTHYLKANRWYHELSVPKKFRTLATGVGGCDVKRVDKNVILLKSDKGFMFSLFDFLFRHPDTPYYVGEKATLQGVTIEITQITEQGTPKILKCTFDRELEDNSLVWTTWSPKGYINFRLPDIGETVTIQPITTEELILFRYP